MLHGSILLLAAMFGLSRNTPQYAPIFKFIAIVGLTLMWVLYFIILTVLNELKQGIKDNV